MPKLPRACAVPGCDRPYRCKGYCNVHYRRWLKTGRAFADPEPEAEPSEEWRTIPEFPDYSASTLGRIRRDAPANSTFVGRILVGGTYPTGYCYVGFSRVAPRRGTVKRKVHALVASAFLGPRPDGMQVNHKDLDKSNNRPSNLEYVTPAGNARHASEADAYARGVRHHMTTLTEDDVREIREHRRCGASRRALAARYGVSAYCVDDIVSRRTWAHVP